MKQKSTPKRYISLVLSLLILPSAFFRGSDLSTLLPSPLKSDRQARTDNHQQGDTRKDITEGDVSSVSKTGGNDSISTDTTVSSVMEAPQSLPTSPSPSYPPTNGLYSSRISPLPVESTQTPSTKDTIQPDTHPTEYADTATIVIALSGEMANNLMHIAHGIGLQQLAKDLYNIDCNLVLRHHVGPNNRAPKPKWKSARNAIQQCFPKLASWDFQAGNNKHFKEQAKRQDSWLGKGRYDYLTGFVNANNQTEIEMGLEYLVRDLLKDSKRPRQDDSRGPIRLPYMLSQTLDAFPLIDKYYAYIREIMVFDNEKCCNRIPELNEYVFHYRNYQSELPRTRAYDMGFVELSPQKTAKELFGHLKDATAGVPRVAVTTRIPNQVARNQVEALKQEGLEAYLVEDQSGVQDFCFLKEAKTELVGNARSTFVFWAALLGNVPNARLYHVDNWGLRNRHPNFCQRFTFNWTHPELKDRIHFELYKAEEMEEAKDAAP